MPEIVQALGLSDLASVAVVRPLVPAYVTGADAPWLGALLEERSRFVGKPRRSWRTRLLEPWKISAPVAKWRAALHVLDRLAHDRSCHAVDPRRLRHALFRAAVAAERTAALDAVAGDFGLDPLQLLDGLFADLPEERLLAPLPGELDCLQLALLCNEHIVSSLLQRALRVRIDARGQTRAVIRQAKLMGLLCVITPHADEQQASVEVSGPFALFRHTRLYGRALASLIPRLARCDGYRLEADCVLKDGREVARLVLKSHAPILPARELPAHDSKLEASFARDFQKLALDWDLVREPAPVAVGAGMCFPDFQLCHRTTGERYWLEIVGFWTPEYLSKKLAQLRAARLTRLILCVDDERSCAPGELEAIGLVLRFRRRIDVGALLALLEQSRQTCYSPTPDAQP